MPIYQYKCETCKRDYEEMQSHDTEHQFVCPECGNKCRRVWSLGGFQFDFWYGFDAGQGEYFDSARQRDNAAAKAGLRRITC